MPRPKKIYDPNIEKAIEQGKKDNLFYCPFCSERSFKTRSHCRTHIETYHPDAGSFITLQFDRNDLIGALRRMTDWMAKNDPTSLPADIIQQIQKGRIEDELLALSYMRASKTRMSFLAKLTDLVDKEVTRRMQPEEIKEFDNNAAKRQNLLYWLEVGKAIGVLAAGESKTAATVKGDLKTPEQLLEQIAEALSKGKGAVSRFYGSGLVSLDGIPGDPAVRAQMARDIEERAAKKK